MSTTGIYSNGFSRAFSDLLVRTGVSCYDISQYSHLDQGYLSRLRNGHKSNPSPETIMRIGLALAHLGKDVRLTDVEKLFRAEGRTLFLKQSGRFL